MLPETHRRIAREIGKELNLGDREASLLGAGSISPNSWANFPHHKGKQFEVIYRILNARLLFLEDDDECYHDLGIALHYIQDKWTLRPRIKDKHTKWEKTIDQCPILDDQQLEEEIKNLAMPTKAVQAYLDIFGKMKEGIQSIADYHAKQLLENSQPLANGFTVLESELGTYGTSVIRFATVSRPTTWSAPFIDINFAYRISLMVARAVLTHGKTPDEPWGNIELLKKVISDFLEWVKAVQAPTLYEYLKKLGVSDRIYGWGLPGDRW